MPDFTSYVVAALRYILEIDAVVIVSLVAIAHIIYLCKRLF
jgi:hypothetical protein